MSEKKRGKNFSAVEKKQFITICLKYKEIIENKKTDKVNMILKNEIWERIKDEFNAIQITGVRDVRGIKLLYDNLRTRAKKKQISEMELCKTSDEFTQQMSSLSSVIVDQFSPEFINQYDSNCSSGSNSSNGEVSPVEDEEIEKLFSTEKPTPMVITPDLQINSPPDPMYPKKRKITYVYKKLSDITDNVNSVNQRKMAMLEREHKRRMEVLDIEKETAQINLENAKKKQRLLDLKLQQLGVD